MPVDTTRINIVSEVRVPASEEEQLVFTELSRVNPDMFDPIYVELNGTSLGKLSANKSGNVYTWELVNNRQLRYDADIDRLFIQAPTTEPETVSIYARTTDTDLVKIGPLDPQPADEKHVYPSILDALKDDMDRIADTLDPNQTDPMKSAMDRIADAIEGGYTPTPSKIILVPEQEVTLEPFTDGLYIANIEASDELVQYQEKDIMCSINGTTGTLYWENGLGWVFPPDTTDPSGIQVCITGTAVPGQISFISSTSISPCVIEAYIDESTNPLSIAHVAISNFCEDYITFVGANVAEDAITYGAFTVNAKTSSVVPVQNINVILYNGNAIVVGTSEGGAVYSLSVTSGSATVTGDDINITGDCEIAIGPERD